MLKSTHRPTGGPSPLPPGWTEHKAPTGHLYYFNAATQQSTYTRPTAPTAQNASTSTGNAVAEASTLPVLLGQQQSYPSHSTFPGNVFANQYQPTAQNSFAGGRGAGQAHHSGRRPPPEDRPRSKHIIPGCEPWLLVKTKLGRRFVYNPDEGESFWKFPPEVMKCVIEYDRLEREKRERRERGEASGSEEQVHQKTHVDEGTAPTAEPRPTIAISRGVRHEDESDEYEEVEVTDDEDKEGPLKRQKLDAEEGPIEFDEEDMAYQLAAMGEDYGLDPGEYGDGQGEDWEEGAEGLPLTEEDSNALFKDMLNDFHIDPYTPWEKIIEEGSIIEDDRYTCLPNMKSRKEVWSEWSRQRIQHLKEQREKEEKKDPKIPYFAFLQKYGTPKLYWPEFRRKYKKEAEMRDAKLLDKDREKWYRHYINRLKLPESSLKSDLTSLLKSLSLRELNRSTSLETLPPTLLTDMRYISLRAQVRDPLIEAFIAISPPAPEESGLTAEEETELVKQRKDRERREKALAERERMVQDEKRKQRGVLQHSKGMLREGEEEIERAMHVGKEGLLSHLEVAQENEPPTSGPAA
ncbi:hypothetical protein MMC17_003209 [Xylographa soralifera]|nr:hypothetical protein [Xylographa soralifera]